MTKHCMFCGEPLKQGERVVVAIVTNYVEIPSSKAWAIEKPEKYVSISHAKCEGIDED